MLPRAAIVATTFALAVVVFKYALQLADAFGKNAIAVGLAVGDDGSAVGSANGGVTTE
jgi:hypothetical protein